MKAIVTKIHDLKESRTEHSFIRIEFLLENGEWAKTDIVPAYRNYKNWKTIIQLFKLQEKVYVDNLFLKEKNEVNADSRVMICDPFEIYKRREEVIIQEKII